MATSRDDFVIAIRSAFLKKGNKQRFSLIVLIFFSIGLLIVSKINLPVTNYLNVALNEIVYRSSFIVSIPEKKIQDLNNKIKDHYNVYNDYLLVKEKLNILQSKKYVTQFLEEENKRIKTSQEEGKWGSSGTAIENKVEIPSIPKTKKGLKFQSAASELNIISDEFFEIIGERGTIWVTRCTGELLDMAPVILVKGDDTGTYDVPSDWIEGFKGASKNFIDGILQGSAPDMNIDFSKQVLEVALSVYKSSEEERTIHINQN